MDIDISEQSADLIVNPDGFYDMQVTPCGKMATVIICQDVEMLWTGAGGSPIYMIVDGKVFESKIGRRPFSITNQNQTFIMLPHHGTWCETNDEETFMPGVYNCHAVVHWNEERKTLYGYANPLLLVDLPSIP